MSDEEVQSPYIETPAPANGIESQDVNQLLTRDALTGTQDVVGMTTEVVLVDPNGTRRFLARTLQARFSDGRIRRDALLQGAYACRKCGTDGLSTEAVLACCVCQTIVCRESCALIRREHAWCRSCWRKTRLREFFEGVLACP